MAARTRTHMDIAGAGADKSEALGRNVDYAVTQKTGMSMSEPPALLPGCW
jgi:hypothetical protein